LELDLLDLTMRVKILSSDFKIHWLQRIDQCFSAHKKFVYSFKMKMV